MHLVHVTGYVYTPMVCKRCTGIYSFTVVTTVKKTYLGFTPFQVVQ